MEKNNKSSRPAGGVALLLQAVAAVCLLPSGQKFSWTTFLEAAVTGLAPFISDAFDTLKDVVFSGLCLQSEHMILKVIGVFSWFYLLGIHVFLVRQDNTLAELVGCYLPVLTAPPKFDLPEESPIDLAGASWSEWAWNKVLPMLPIMYKQVTPTKRELLENENVPQAFFSIVYLCLEGGSLFVGVINLGVPMLQIVATYVLFKPLRSIVGPQFGQKLSEFVENADFLKAKKLWNEALRSAAIQAFSGTYIV